MIDNSREAHNIALDLDAKVIVCKVQGAKIIATGFHRKRALAEIFLYGHGPPCLLADNKK